MKKRTALISAGTAFIILIVLLFLIQPSKTVKMGFIADLTGRQSQLGISVRNGFLMAVNELNSAGGLKGREIIPIIKNNENNIETCLTKTGELIEEKVNVIIGPLTSAMVIPVLEGAGDTLIISPTVSTDKVTGIDDMFFRIIPAASMQGGALAEAVLENNEKNIVIVIDERNSEYTGAFADGLIKRIEAMSDILFNVIPFNDKSQFSHITESIYAMAPDALVFASSGVDTAGIIQQLAKKGILPHLYSSYWGKASNVHEYGGNTVEGMILIAGYENREISEREKDFQERYGALYEIKANFAARYSYEAVMLYAEAVEKGNSFNKDVVKSEILEMDRFQGITDSYSLDDFGDVIRDQTLFIIHNNQYEYY
jgi:branched-chain amino acid transport system substrate-binding protein